MKNRFSIERALGDGLKLTFKRPLTIFLWGLLSLAPFFVILGAVAPLLGNMGELRADPSASPFGANVLVFNLAIQAANGLQLVIAVFVAAAVIRATAAAHRRHKARPPFLGVGIEELLTAASMLGAGIGLCAVIFPLVLVGVGLGFGFYSMGGIWVWLPVTLYALIAGAGVIYLALRLSLLVPASALTGTLALPAAWHATRGQTLRLLGLGLLSWLVQLVMSLAAMTVIALLVVAIAVATGWRWETLKDIETLTDTALPLSILAVAAIAVVVLAWQQGMTQAMTLAPFTSAWLQLNPPKSPEAADATPSDAVASAEL